MALFKFCPECGQPLPTVGRRNSTQHCIGCGRTFYQNSKPCAGALVVKEGRVLLVRRAIAPFKGWWDIPGGFLEAGEEPRRGAVREVLEETGLVVETHDLLDIFIDTYGSSADFTLNIYYLAVPVGGAPKPGSDAKELGWFAKDKLPNRIAFANGRAALKAWTDRQD